MSDSNNSFLNVVIILFIGAFFATTISVSDSLEQIKGTFVKLPTATQQEAPTPQQ